MITRFKLKKLIELSKSCSECAMYHYNSSERLNYKYKKDKSPLTKADLAVNKIAVNGIKNIFQNDQIISEENFNEFRGKLNKKFWLIDPIDGTKEFIFGNSYFSVNFALIYLNKVVFGLIVQPVTNCVWFTYEHKSWKIDGSFDIERSYQIKASVVKPDNIRLLATKNHGNIDLENWIKIVKPIKRVSIGSSLKFCYLSEGLFDIYIRNTPTSEWDVSAGHAILKNAGGNVFTENGLELQYGKVNLKNKIFIATGKINDSLPGHFYLGNQIENLDLYKNQITQSVCNLKKEKLVCFPTETVYGIGASSNSNKAVDLIYKIKKRPKKNPLIVHVKNLNDAKSLSIFTNLAKKLTKAFWPGPLTIVLQIDRNNPLAKAISHNGNTIALRYPSHPLALDLLKKFNHPILAPSANKSGGVSPTSASHVRLDFETDLKKVNPDIGYILDFGKTEIGLESTIIDCRGKKPLILREGSITSEMIEHYTKIKSVNINKNKKIISPGMLPGHYSPKTKVLINQEEFMLHSGVLSFGKRKKTFKKATIEFNLSPTKNLIQAAQLLYEGLRYLDQFNLKFIQVYKIPKTGIGKAINDRLMRASYGR